MVVFPPIYVITHQLQNYFKESSSEGSSKIVDHLDLGQIVLSFILTSCFYFPGLLHALTIMKGKEKCGSIFK